MEAFFYDKLLVTYLTRCIAKYLFLLVYLRAHNPKVGGSNPSPATKTRPSVSKEKLAAEKLAISWYIYCTLRADVGGKKDNTSFNEK